MAHGGVTVVNRLEEVLGTLLARPRHVAVGILGAKAAETKQVDAGDEVRDVTVAQVATWLHYGVSTQTSEKTASGASVHAIRIPARPFISVALERHGAEIQKRFARITRGVLEEKLTLDQALGLMGESVVGEIKKTIAEGVPPSNADSTKDKKRSSTPLIDTGQLRGSVAYQVRDGVGEGVL
jgi:hypothetical protein